jgi:hypothetical protein
MFTGEQMISLVIPPKSYHGLTIRLQWLGRRPHYRPGAPHLDKENKGHLLVTLSVYPDQITPLYGSFDALSTEDMALEGWVYRTFDEIIPKIDTAFRNLGRIRPDMIAELFNTGRWRSIFDTLRDHLRLSHLRIDLTTSASLVNPGNCVRTVANDPQNPDRYRYTITINERFLDNPFAIAAILAHELCHIVYSEKIEQLPRSVGQVIRSEKAILHMERTVDMLVFMFKMGEFQLRVARDTRLTLGYFNQDVFERMQVIVSRKLSAL